MAILTRLARLLQADLHALLDRMEAPDVLLQQSLREMEADLQLRRQQQRQQEQQLQQLQNLLHNRQQQMSRHQAELDLCLDAGNDSLARSLLRRQLETRQQLEMLQHRCADLQHQIATTNETLQQEQSTYENLKAQADCVLPPAPGVDITAVATPSPITDADIELALLQARQARSTP